MQPAQKRPITRSKCCRLRPILGNPILRMAGKPEWNSGRNVELQTWAHDLMFSPGTRPFHRRLASGTQWRSSVKRFPEARPKTSEGRTRQTTGQQKFICHTQTKTASWGCNFLPGSIARWERPRFETLEITRIRDGYYGRAKYYLNFFDTFWKMPNTVSLFF